MDTLKKGSEKCKKGTRKYRPLGSDCYTNSEIMAVKKTRHLHKKTGLSKKPKPTPTPKLLTDFEIVGEEPEVFEEKIVIPHKKKTKKVKLILDFEIVGDEPVSNEKIGNETMVISQHNGTTKILPKINPHKRIANFHELFLTVVENSYGT